MKILILNGYSNNPKGVAAFKNFESIVKGIFSTIKQMIDTEIEFLVRDRKSVEEFLYEVDSAYVRIEAGKYFDQIDIVFFEGDANMRPWSPKAQTLLLFLRMCLRGNKILFASSFAMQALVYLIASNSDKTINIINGINGGQLGDLSKLSKNLLEIRSTDLFLDNVTGDLYGFNYETGEWATKANAGIHYRRSAEEFKTVGKYIIKAPQYKSTRIKELEQIFVSKSNESVCSMRKNNMHHYLFEDIPFEFMVPFKNAWDVHPFNFVNPKKTFLTLADYPKGPMIIEVSSNIIGIQFNVSQKYPETVKILKNFIMHQIDKLCSNHRNQIPIEVASIQVHENALDILLEEQARLKTHADQKTVHGQQNIRFNVITDFHHAGYASRKTGGTLNLVLNNAINPKVIKHQPELHSDNKASSMQSGYWESKSNSHFSKQMPKAILKAQSIHSQNLIEDFSKQQHTLNDDMENPHLSKTKSEIRAFLHPDFDRQLLPKKQAAWVACMKLQLDPLQTPGQLSQQTPSSSSVIRILNTTASIFSKRKITRHEGSIDSRGPCISTGSPYMTQDEFRRKIEKQADEKILAHKKFVCNVPQTKFIPNYVTRTPSEPANQHKYRTTSKDHWVSATDFRLC